MNRANKPSQRFVHWPARPDSTTRQGLPEAAAERRGTTAGLAGTAPAPIATRRAPLPAAVPGPSRCLPRRSGLDSDAVRQAMVDRLRQQGDYDERVLQALLAVPRHHFVEPALAAQAYLDNALPIGHEQTISKPSVIARGLDAALRMLAPRQTLGKVLDIGTGCGYAAAVTARIADDVYSVERIRALHDLARANLRALRVPNLRLLLGDGMAGCPAGAPFDVIISAAAALEPPQAWLDQLAIGGVLVAPLGDPQQLVLLRKRGTTRFEVQSIEGAKFVPLKSGLK